MSVQIIDICASIKFCNPFNPLCGTYLLAKGQFFTRKFIDSYNTHSNFPFYAYFYKNWMDTMFKLLYGDSRIYIRKEY